MFTHILFCFTNFIIYFFTLCSHTNSHTQANITRWLHTCILCTYFYKHTHMCMYKHTYKCTHMNTHTHAGAHTHTHTHTRTDTPKTNIHTYTHSQGQIQPKQTCPHTHTHTIKCTHKLVSNTHIIQINKRTLTRITRTQL